MTDVIIFVPPEVLDPWVKICAIHCARADHNIRAVVSNWEDVVRVLKDDDDIEIVVVGTREHLPPDRRWRIEAVIEPTPTDPPERRRPMRR